MEVPSFIKDGMMAGLYNARCCVDVHYILVGGRVAQKYSREVMSVQLATASARALDTHARAKCLEVGHIRSPSVPALKRCDARGRVDESILEVHGVKERGRPEFSQEPRPIEECTNHNS